MSAVVEAQVCDRAGEVRSGKHPVQGEGTRLWMPYECPSGHLWKIAGL